MIVGARPWAIVVAGGNGTRFGGRKQLARLGSRRVIDWSIDALRPFVEGIVAVVPSDLVEGTSEASDLAVEVVVAGGATRSASVRAGLEALPPATIWVLVHDAARPMASHALVGRVVAALAGDGSPDGVVPVVPLTDTLRRRTGGAVDRSEFVAVQTPQGFSVATLRRAHGAEADATDDATLVDAIGGVVVHVEGEVTNMKITAPEDLRVAEVLHDC
jgi:2-C-methyl-D-erythritol 4-phosphate cytidylyltransferase